MRIEQNKKSEAASHTEEETLQDCKTSFVSLEGKWWDRRPIIGNASEAAVRS